VTEKELLDLTLASADRLKRFAFHLCGRADEAEDLVQEGFVRALARRSQLRDPTRAVPWLYRIVRSLFLDRYRLAQRQQDRLAEEGSFAEPPVGNLEEEILGAGFSDEVAAALAALPEAWRTCLLLCDVDELGYDEIAEIVACPVGTVRSRLARARAQLLARLRQGTVDRRGAGKGARP
jgi:RNA polymerase sigma-70 factor, ECF subfamily